MITRALLLAAAGLALAGCGIYGSKGNDTGGIIPWSPDAENVALITANNNCSMFHKYGVITSVRRVPGDFITYECRFNPEVGRERRWWSGI